MVIAPFSPTFNEVFAAYIEIVGLALSGIVVAVGLGLHVPVDASQP